MPKKESFLYRNNHNLSLKGKSGTIFGLISILFIYTIDNLIDQFIAGIGIGLVPISIFEIILFVCTFLYIIISFTTITLINKKRRIKLHLFGWNKNSKIIASYFCIAILFVAIITFILLQIGLLKLIIPSSLLIYGITYLLIKKYTNGNSTIFGTLFILNAAIAFVIPNYMFILWGLAFGGYHIIYGIYEAKFLRNT